MTAAEQNSSPPNSPSAGVTSPSQHQQPSPRLPHEHDESSDSQKATETQEPSDVGKQAYADVQQGLVDTDKGPVLEELHRKLPEKPRDTSADTTRK